MAENPKENTTKELIINCLTQQLSEFELLKAMYPEHGDIILNDKYIIDEINNFVENKTQYFPNHLEFKLNLVTNNTKLELFINLPSSYPEEEPDIYVRCNELNRQNETKLNSELTDYLKQNHDGEVCLYTAISWLQENIDNYTVPQAPRTDSVDEAEASGMDGEYARLWIYSHHIYNKKKREEIVKKAHELKLTGFSLPGKPGIVCIEGLHRDCKEWWKDIKSMAWKKIIIRNTELFEPQEHATYKKFHNFEEIGLSKSKLAKYMFDLGLGAEFNDLFGLCSEE